MKELTFLTLSTWLDSELNLDELAIAIIHYNILVRVNCAAAAAVVVFICKRNQPNAAFL